MVGNNNKSNTKYDLLCNIKIVLVVPSHPGNIGAVARAMKNMGLSRLTLVSPKNFPSLQASTRASSAADILHAAEIVDTLNEAIEGSKLVFGTSSRLRKVEWPQKTVRQTAQMVVSTIEKNCEVAVVFGRENSGLTNKEMDKCDYLSYIPTNLDYSSLNLSQAVQVFSYECRMAIHDASKQGVIDSSDYTRKASSAEMEGFYNHLYQTLKDIEFLDQAKSSRFMRRMRRLFNRAKLDCKEIDILRGILTAAQRKSKSN